MNVASSLLPLVALLGCPVLHAAVVFADDFSEPNGTAIIGKAPDVGSAWTGTAPTISGGSFDSTGAARAAFGDFTSPLGAGQMITLSYETLPLAGNNFFTSGYAGISLYIGGAERLFTGDIGNAPFWGVDLITVGGAHPTTDATAVTTATLTYVYDTGFWSFTTGSGVALSGTGLPGEAFNRVRLSNGFGGDLRVDNVVVDISAVPEPTSLALLGIGAGFGWLRRRR